MIRLLPEIPPGVSPCMPPGSFFLAQVSATTAPGRWERLRHTPQLEELSVAWSGIGNAGAQALAAGLGNLRKITASAPQSEDQSPGDPAGYPLDPLPITPKYDQATPRDTPRDIPQDTAWVESGRFITSYLCWTTLLPSVFRVSRPQHLAAALVLVDHSGGDFTWARCGR